MLFILVSEIRGIFIFEMKKEYLQVKYGDVIKANPKLCKFNSIVVNKEGLITH